MTNLKNFNTNMQMLQHIFKSNFVSLQEHRSRCNCSELKFANPQRALIPKGCSAKRNSWRHSHEKCLSHGMRSNITAADLNENSRNCDANPSKLLHVSWTVQRGENSHHDCVKSNLLFLQQDKSYYDCNWIKIHQSAAQIIEGLL